MSDERRRLSIADGMIVVAAVAVGLVLVRGILPMAGVSPRGALAWGVVALLADLLAPLSPAVLLIRLRPPRPTFRRLARQPGFAACLVASASSGLVAILIGIDRLIHGQLNDTQSWCILTAHSAGLAVIGSWITLAALGRWRRPGARGLERLSRLVGWAWLVVLGMVWAVTMTVH